jgi:hypothetical protein
MARPDFNRMRDQLLRNGVSVRVASRTVTELDEHYDDLESEALAAGMTADEASEYASRQIGEPQTLLHEISCRVELRCWIFRYPGFARVLLPLAWILILPATPLIAGVAHLSSIVRWTACLLLSALVTAAMMLVMQISLTLS